MKTLRLAIHATDVNRAASLATIEAAAAILREGGTVAFPTETVYGLGANALDADAVRKIFIAKQRPQWDPLIVHIADAQMLRDVVSTISADSQALMDAFWPGPLTLLLPKTDRIPGLVTAGRPLVGVRMPSHPVAAALIRAAALPVAAPSANSFGRISPTLATHVLEDLDGLIDAVLDAGETAHGLESAVVDATAHVPILYRPGVITLERLRSVCPNAIAFEAPSQRVQTRPASLPSPGLSLRHYAPRARLILIDCIDRTGEQQRLNFAVAVASARAAGEKVGIMLLEEYSGDNIGADFVYAWGRWSRAAELAQRLFGGLRALDAAGASVIVCPLPEAGGIGTALRDRLLKAARPR